MPEMGLHANPLQGSIHGMKSSLILIALLPLALMACSADRPCVVCYEDEWSREPFPGQPKQHIKPLTPEDLKNNRGSIPHEFLGSTAAESPTERW